jgi:hypothetical protein
LFRSYYDEYGNLVYTDEYGNPYYAQQSNDYYGQQGGGGEGYYDEHDVDQLPPQEEAPQQRRQQSALDISVLGQIKSGRVLRRAAPPPPKPKSTRDTVMDLIKDGGITLRKAEPIQKATEQVSEKRGSGVARLCLEHYLHQRVLVGTCSEHRSN